MFTRFTSALKQFFFLLFFLGLSFGVLAQTTETISTGSFIINMGVTPQTVGNALKPYGLVYAMLKNFSGPIKWVIEPTKAKDGTDFTYNGVAYKGGTFIIPAEARNAAVNSFISTWQGQGVVGVTTTSPITVPVYTTLTFVPRWVLDEQNGSIAVNFFTNAGIPATAHGGTSSSGWMDPQKLDCCVDLFVMPHADPTWATHSRLFSWNLDCKGAIWLGCHAGSALEDMFNPGNTSQQTNFLANKTGNATGAGPYSQNALLLWGNHSDGTLPYSYDYPADPIMQFMGILDAATQNGSEQIYIPMTPGWRPTTKVGVYDPDHPQQPSTDIQHRAAILAWGKGFGDANRGHVMLEASHSIAKATTTANIAAQRAFFNFSLVALAEKSIIPTIAGLPASNSATTVSAGVPIPLSVSVPAPALISSYTITWKSNCGGTFSPSTSAANVTFTPPSTPGKCHLTVVIKDACGRETFDCRYIDISPCKLTITSTLKQPCAGASNGAISLTATGGVAPYSYAWTRTGGGTGSGAGTNLTGLTAGTYAITITDSQGCTSTQTIVLNASPAITPTATPVASQCNSGSTGAVNLSVTGGVAPYSYDWGSGITTQNRSGLGAGTYTVTITDANGCTASASASVTAPAALVGSTTVTNATCFGAATGAVSLAVTGGTSPYTYLWNDGTGTQNRTGLAAGTYSVTIKDANNCTQAVTGITVGQPAAGLSIATTPTPPLCGGANGAVSATVTGGTSPYTYDWSGTPTGDGTATITGLAAGNYDLTVTDAKGCVALKSTTLAPQTAIALSAVIITPTCPPATSAPLNSDGAITLTVVGGTAPFTYAWTTSGGAGLTPANKNQTGLTDGTYTVLVTDANGCTATRTYVLNYANPAPTKPGAITKN
jgi:hypothetical protein